MVGAHVAEDAVLAQSTRSDDLRRAVDAAFAMWTSLIATVGKTVGSRR